MFVDVMNFNKMTTLAHFSVMYVYTVLSAVDIMNIHEIELPW